MYSDSDNYNYDNGNENTNKNGNNSSAFMQNNKTKLIICGALVLLIIILIFVVFKGNGGGYIVKLVPIENVTVPQGGTFNLTATVNDSKGNAVSNPIINWTTGNAEIATVNNGVVSGVNYGKTTVVATYTASNGKSYQSQKEVTVADGVAGVTITDISIPDGELVLPLNQDYKINLEITPSNGYVENKEYTSSNENVVIVDKTGKITSIGEGEATISVRVNNGAFNKDLKVIVDSDAKDSGIVDYPTNISFDPSVNSVTVGGTAKLVLITTPTNARSDQLTWSSSDTNILTVDNNGNITGVAAGTATVTASSINNVSGKIDVTVGGGDIQKIEFSPMEVSFDMNNNAVMTLIVNTPVMLTPIVTPTNPSNPMLTFTPSNPTIVSVTVDSSGTMATLTGLQAGTCELSVKSSNNIESKVLITVVSNGGSSGSCGSCNNKKCDAGKYCSCGSCITCKAGSYCDSTGMHSCPAGKTSKVGAKALSDCYYCDKGYYSTGDGKGCVACPSGKTTSSSGSSSKDACITVEDSTKTCNKGYYNFNGECKICPKGNYCPDGKTYKSCSAGTGSNIGATSQAGCGTCPAGTYSRGTGYGCTKCLDGYTSNENKTDCVKGKTTITCAKGKYYNGSSCVDCTIGYYCVGFSEAIDTSKEYGRVSCPTGKYQSKSGMSYCDSCNDGKTTTSRGSTSATACH